MIAEEAGHPHRWRVLGVLAVAELLTMSVWFAASAVSGQLQALWNLDAGQTAWLTTAVQIGFVAGTAAAALLNIADIVEARYYVAVSALSAAAANAFLLAVPGYKAAIILRFLTGFFLAGVYPPAMKMVATWFRSGRGLAIAILVASLTVGKATPYLVRAFGGADYQIVVLVTAVGALLGSALVGFAYREGPYPFERRPFSWGLAGTVIRHRETRLATAAYLGHMWELYAMWTWIPAFLAASGAAYAARGGPGAGSDVFAFAAIAAGGLGCVWGGWAADRIGRERVVTQALVASGACAIAIGMLFGQNPWLVGGLACMWGFFVVADSAQFSALVTEVAPRHAVGTALMIQTSLGFLLTGATIQAVPRLQSTVGWPWAFAVLATGPVAGIAAIQRLARLRGEKRTTVNRADSRQTAAS